MTMKQETTAVLYKVQDKLNEIRKMLDDHMYRGEIIPNKDLTYCRKVYDSICKTLDLL